MSGKLDGNVAVVTGASRGIGAAIATTLGAQGARVVAAARSTTERPGKLSGTLEGTVAAIEARGGTAIAVPTDLADPAQREALIATAEREYGQVDILVNNAAVTFFAPASRFKLGQAELMFTIGVHAPLHLSQLVLPGMRSRGRGWICNLTSDVAKHPRVPPSRFGAKGTTTVYGMCKAALERFTSGLAAEVHGDGIAVNAIGPAKVVPTPGTIFHGVTTADNPDAESPAVLAEAVLRLCTAEADGVSGRVLRSQDFLTELDERAKESADA